jgi:chromosome segregation ATPase
MRKIIAILLASMTIWSCSNDSKQNEEQIALQDTINANKEALVKAIADRDSLFSLINDISDDMDQIKSLENILASNTWTGETSSKKEKIKNDLQILKNTLQQRQQKLNELEKKLKDSKLTNTKLEKTIETLKSQIAEYQVEIENLNTALTSAKGQIVKLENDKDSLNKTITTVSAEKAKVEEIAEEAITNVNELNKCFYAIGSKKELKQNKILESGFLKKTKVMQGEYDQKFFSVADKRTLKKINLHSKKAKILTNHPANSYELQDVDGQKTLQITNPSIFWNLSNYLVIQID